ncbi:hypothetical protein CMQ_7274 [Grosmannia clavigera kw1407]|uniref:Uncharacterized protein n=1 Tax=Grosmannia clavigera (strain kw1407 / UAMH 11150) TaxID=655863 RepID=F0XPD3_GROCL|nr:uncharacterized protein CMQ_7274 [Grosmannia clavigera kw1407]EFX00272.1 hypothetical protein CMQ_7274 [Grosmannia clavigera kw1407]
MLPTKSYSSLKGMLPRIHHPLPLNEKSTKKLLDTLTTSFRKHLDREHGWLEEEDAAPRRALRRGAPTESMPAAAPLFSLTAQPATHRPTDHHLRAILANPLFSYDQTVRSEVRQGTERDPMDIFDWAVARGLMTPKRAAGCLLAKRREAVLSSSVSAKASMAASGAGLKVLQWLRAAGLERDLSFVADVQLTGVLVQFLAAEDQLDEVVWTWIERLRGDGAAASAASASFLLDRLVKAKAGGAVTLDEAYRTMARGAEVFRHGTQFSKASANAIFWTWCYLSWKSTFKAWNLSSPSPQLYEAFVAIMDDDDRPSIRLERAHLDLRHPTHPSPAPAVALLADDDLLHSIQTSTATSEPPPPGRVPAYPGRIVSMGLDTVRHLAFVGEPAEAQRILDRLRQQFGGHLDQMSLHTSADSLQTHAERTEEADARTTAHDVGCHRFLKSESRQGRLVDVDRDDVQSTDGTIASATLDASRRSLNICKLSVMRRTLLS